MQQVTQCKSAPSTTHFDATQFDGRCSRPVSALYVGANNGINGWESNGISFQDYGSMQTSNKKVSGERRLATPVWATNDSQLQKVICECLFVRAFGNGRHLRDTCFQTTVRMSPLEKLRFAEKILHQRLPILEARIERLMIEYVEVKRSGVVVEQSMPVGVTRKKAPLQSAARRLRTLEILIEGVDSQIIINRNAGAILTAVFYGYFRERLDSVAVASATGLRPPCVRQLTFRACKIAKALGFESEPRQASEVNRAGGRKALTPLG